MISAPMAACTVTGTSCSQGSEQIEALGPGKLLPLASARARPSPMPWLARAAARDGGVHLRAGLLRHPEAAIGQAGLHVLAGPAEGRELEVVDGGGAIHGDVGDDPAGQPGVHQGAQTDLDHVAAQQKDHAPARAWPRRRIDDVRGDRGRQECRGGWPGRR